MPLSFELSCMFTSSRNQKVGYSFLNTEISNGSVHAKSGQLQETWDLTVVLLREIPSQFNMITT